MATRTSQRDALIQGSRKQSRPTPRPVRSGSPENIMDKLLDQVRVRLEGADISAQHALLGRLLSSEPGESANPAGNDLVAVLSQGRRYSPEETLAMELEMLGQAFELRHRLLQGALTSTQVAQLLGTKRQTPHDRLKSGSLLGIEENGRWLFPYWQFDAAGPNGVVEGLPTALRALGVSALAKANWLTLPNPYLEGRSPLQALKAGDVDRVVDIAGAVGAVGAN